jgi:putative transposase
MTMKRRQHSAQSKAMIALEAVKERKTVNELAAEYEVHPTQISQWKRQLLDGLPDLFSSRRGKGARDESPARGVVPGDRSLKRSWRG